MLAKRLALRLELSEISADLQSFFSVIAPGYSKEAFEILSKKKGGK